MKGTALVVGAGIGGLAAGVALRKSGWRVRIFERAAAPRELGFALNLAPNAMIALRELGLEEQLLAGGSRINDAEIRHENGQVLRNLSVSKAIDQVSSVVALRPVLHGTLLQATEPDSLSLESEVVDFESTESGVKAYLSDGSCESGDLLVGADGIYSAVRAKLHNDNPPLRRSGFYGMRGVAHGAAHHLGNLSAVSYLCPRIEAATVRAGGESVYWYLSLLASDVASANRDVATIISRCGERLDHSFRAITNSTTPDDIRLDELFDRDPLAEWGRGRVTLLGDAAHPMLPHTGQGAAQALEDAVALGIVLAGAIDVPAALRNYERVRAARTRSVVFRGRRLAAATTTGNELVDKLRATAVRIVPKKLLVSSFLLIDTSDPHKDLRSP